LVLAVAVGVFSQSSLPLLFLPVMAVVLFTFRMGRVGAALAIVMLAFVGATMTAAGYGPIQLIGPGEPGTQMQFFQFYLAATVLTILPISADLHNRKKLLQRVRLSEERFRLMAEHSSDLMLHISAAGRFLYVSPSMLQIAGYDPADLIGTPSSRLIAPEFLDEVRHEHLNVFNQPGSTRRYEYQGIMADGSRRWFETHSRALVDEDGQVDGVLSIVRDITDNKDRERQLSTAALTDLLPGLPKSPSLAEPWRAAYQGGVG
jgi:PAS domain S-box-containing protein